MPKSMVEMVVEDAKKKCPHSGLFSHYAVEAVSSVFNVSFEAATYRLKQLGILASSVTISGDLLNAVLQQQMAAYIC